MIEKILAWLLTTILLTTFTSAKAQQAKKVPRIGYLGAYSASAGAPLLEAFHKGMHEIGYVEGRNILIHYRWAEGRPERLASLADELIQLRVDVIVTHSNAAVAALQHATRTIPIVVAVMGDPVGSGFVTSLARPGGNITGFATLAESLAGKWVELLKEAVPTISRFGVLAVSQTAAHRSSWTEIQAAAQALQTTPQRQDVAGRDQIEHAQGLIVLPHAITLAHRIQIVGHAAKSRLPAIYPDRQFIEAGGLMSYGTNFSDLHRRAAIYVDRILKGAAPADLPVEQPTKIELVVNSTTAKALGLTRSRAKAATRTDHAVQLARARSSTVKRVLGRSVGL
jgi:putative tryptophan/tyrosine transport system substrate-binding protein